MRIPFATATLLLVGVSLTAVAAYPPIPHRPPGFAKGSDKAPVVLEAFFDLLCPDSKAAWPVIKQVLDVYGDDKLQFRLHLFPLPYHTFSFATNQATFVLSNHSYPVWPWVDAAFEHQETFYNSETYDTPYSQVILMLSNLASQTSGISNSTFVKGMYDRDLNVETRIAWKYATSRSITGTPQYLVNGVPVDADASWTVSQWKELLNPLYQ